MKRRGGRVFLLLGVLLVVIVIAVFLWMSQSGDGGYVVPLQLMNGKDASLRFWRTSGQGSSASSLRKAFRPCRSGTAWPVGLPPKGVSNWTVWCHAGLTWHTI